MTGHSTFFCCTAQTAPALSEWKSQALTWILVIFAAWNGGAQEAAVMLDRNPVVAGQPFRLTFEFRNANAQFNAPPPIEGLTYLRGPSTSSSTQIINNARTDTRSYTYDVRAEQPGMMRIPSLTFRSNSGMLKTEPINLQVLKPGSTAGQPRPQFEAVIEADRTSVHLGEPIRLQYRIYNRMDAVEVRNYSFPELSGAWKETVEGEDPRWENTIVEGQRVQMATVRTDIIYPTRTGPLEIKGFDVEAQQRVSLFNSRPISVAARPVSIEVRPLPAPIPATSIGTFSQLKVTWKMESGNAPKTNEAVNLVLEFQGKGNLPLIGAPDIDWPKDLEVFDPEMENRVTTDSQGQRGRRTMTYLVIPRAQGQYTIELPEMVYFDHGLDRYVSLSAPPVSMEVSGAENGAASFGFNSKTDVTILTRDMRFIRTETTLSPRSRPFFGGPLHMSFWALPPGLFLLVAARRRRKEEENRNPAVLRRKSARSALKAALAEARRGGASLDALGQAAHEFLQAFLDMARSDAGMERYRAALADAPDGLASEWLDLLAVLDRGRFAPGAPQPEDVAARLEDAVRALEKWKPNRPIRNGRVGAAGLILALSLGSAHAAPDAGMAHTLFQQANTAYLEGEFETAIGFYEDVAQQWTSFELEYNLGVAYYKSGQIGPAILHFERAKRIRPGDDDLQANLLLAKAAVVDRIEEMPEVALAPLWRELTAEYRLVTWTVLSLIGWALACLLLAFRLFTKDVATRRTIIITAPTLAILALLLGFLSRQTHSRSRAEDGAVIMAPRIEIMSSPTIGGESSTLFVLHEGTVVEVLGIQDEWRQIRLANGNTGWLQAPNLAPI